MTNPYIGKLNPAVGKGLGGLPRKVGDGDGGGGGSAGNPPFDKRYIKNREVWQVSAFKTGAHTLSFEVSDPSKTTIRASLYSNNQATFEMTESVFSEYNNTLLQFITSTKEVTFRLTTSTNVQTLTNESDWPISFEVIEYDFDYLSLEVVGPLPDTTTSTVTLSTPIPVPSNCILVTNSSSGRRVQQDRAQPAGFEALMPHVSLSASGTTGTSIRLSDKDTLSYTTSTEDAKVWVYKLA